jgi:TolA protein
MNPVANDTQNVIPPPKPQPAKQKLPDPEAIALKSRDAKKKAAEEAAAYRQKYKAAEARPNQVTSSTGQAAVSQMFTPLPGGGGVGSGSENPFGYGFGWYAALMRDKVARNWNRQGLDVRVQVPTVTIFFDVQRDGSIRNARIAQPSGNYLLDQSALRAVMTSSPFQPLPPQLPKDSYTISLEFRLTQ